MSSGLIDNPLTAGVVYTLALGAIYKGTQRNLTVCPLQLGDRAVHGD